MDEEEGKEEGEGGGVSLISFTNLRAWEVPDLDGGKGGSGPCARSPKPEALRQIPSQNPKPEALRQSPSQHPKPEALRPDP